MRQGYKVNVLVAVISGLVLFLLLLVCARAQAISDPTLSDFGALGMPMNPGPDLAIEEITLEPPVPVPSQPTTITIVVKNVGTNRVEDGFYTFLYIDPVDQPPDPATPDTSYFGWFVGLNPGASFSWTYSDVLSPAGGEHTIYAWVDRDDAVVEDDEENNLSYITVEAIGSSELLAVPTYALGNSMVWVASVVRDTQGNLLAGQGGITGTVGSTEITFVDDGSEGDFEAYDGVYGAWVEASGGGTYSVTLYAKGEMLVLQRDFTRSRHSERPEGAKNLSFGQLTCFKATRFLVAALLGMTPIAKVSL